MNIQEETSIDDKILQDVKDPGWSVIMVDASSYLPSFAYTIGLWKNYKHPEIISFGLTVKTLHAILNIAGAAIKRGASYRAYTNYTGFFESSESQFIPIDKRNLRDYFSHAIWFNEGVDFPAMQLVWTDRNGKFPWQDNYQEEFKYRQPLLDRNADFKFREEKNVAVFTTRQWLEERKPILHVVHDDEGDWQFLTGDQLPEDGRLVVLEQMLFRDNTLNELFNLDYGEQAKRTELSGEWVRSKADNEEDDMDN